VDAKPHRIFAVSKTLTKEPVLILFLVLRAGIITAFHDLPQTVHKLVGAFARPFSLPAIPKESAMPSGSQKP
jgi:hypothetical protein